MGQGAARQPQKEASTHSTQVHTMHFRIADTFTDSLARLTADEQKAVKTTAFDLQMNPASPGMSFHRLDRARDKNFWSVRAGSDLRLIVHRTDDSILLCYVNHHDKAYDWAERRKLEAHPKTGAAQLVEIRERVEQIVVPHYVDAPAPRRAKQPLFAGIAEESLLEYGVPAEWIAEVQGATEDSILDLVGYLPQEAAEALLELATGGKPRTPTAGPASVNPFDHPDAQRRFRLMTDAEELKAALESPWDKWTIFLHPSQREWVQRDFAGPSRVSGSAGTGKTIVALHRAVALAQKNPESRVLLTTFTDALAKQLHTRLRRLISAEPRLGERIDVASLDSVGARLYAIHVGKGGSKVHLSSPGSIGHAIDAAIAAGDAGKFSRGFLQQEWADVVDAWQIGTWEEYRTVPRLGRKTRLSEGQRGLLWAIFADTNQRLADSGILTRSQMFAALAAAMKDLEHPPYDFIIVDESQDISISQLKFLAAISPAQPNALFFAGDLGQRIFQVPFSWRSLGVDIRGRSRTLRVNYRTSHQIRSQADRLLSQQLTDVDGNPEDRRGTVSVFNGPPPLIRTFGDQKEEITAVAVWLSKQLSAGVAPHEIGIIVRTTDQIPRAQAAAQEATLKSTIIDDTGEQVSGIACILSMHMAKGLEFRAVAVMACDEEVIPLQSRLEAITDEADLEEIYNTERHLLYVACTRARDHLMLTAVSPKSEFLDDLASD